MAGTRFRRSRRIAAVTIAIAVALPLLPAHAADGVRTTRALELSGSAAGGHLAWTQAPRSEPSRFSAYFRPAGGSRRRLNAAGTKGFTTGGAIDEDRSTVAYWQRKYSRADIKFYDVSSGRRRSAPAKVNTQAHEWGAALSGPWLLFARGSYGGRMQIFLFNRSTQNVRRLARGDGGTYLQPGDVTGRWVTWTRCRNNFRTCRNYRYDSRTSTTRALRNPTSRHQFAPSVMGNGTVYFAESRNINTCGSRLQLYGQTTSGSRRRLTTLPSGTSVGTTSVQRVGSNRVSVLYDQSRCDRPASDLYRIRVRG